MSSPQENTEPVTVAHPGKQQPSWVPGTCRGKPCVNDWCDKRCGGSFPRDGNLPAAGEKPAERYASCSGTSLGQQLQERLRSSGRSSSATGSGLALRGEDLRSGAPTSPGQSQFVSLLFWEGSLPDTEVASQTAPERGLLLTYSR